MEDKVDELLTLMERDPPKKCYACGEIIAHKEEADEKETAATHIEEVFGADFVEVMPKEGEEDSEAGDIRAKAQIVEAVMPREDFLQC